MNKPAICACLLTLLLLACQKDTDILVYTVPKETETTPTSFEISPSPSLPFSYTPPPSWMAQARGTMRLASYKTEDGIDISLIALPGQSGGLNANINRWRGQVQLPPQSDAKNRAAHLSTLTVQNRTIQWLEISGEHKGILLAIIPSGDEQFFFKLSGDTDKLSAHKKALRGVVESLKFD